MEFMYTHGMQGVTYSNVVVCIRNQGVSQENINQKPVSRCLFDFLAVLVRYIKKSKNAFRVAKNAS